MIKEIVDNWLDSEKIDLIDNYDRLGLRASGNWAESLDEFSDVKDSFIKIGIEGADYTEQLENGRRPNRDQSDEALKRWVGWAGSTFLKDWVEEKSINANPYAIAWKIAREGWQVPNANNTGGLVSDVVTREKMVDLSRDIMHSVIEDFKSDVIKILK